MGFIFTVVELQLNQAIFVEIGKLSALDSYKYWDVSLSTRTRSGARHMLCLPASSLHTMSARTYCPDDMLRTTERLNLLNPDMWGMRIGCPESPWYQIMRPRVQHLLRADTLSSLSGEMALDRLPRMQAPLYDYDLHNSFLRQEVEYWQHLAHDDISKTEMVFTVAPNTLREDNTRPLRWSVGDMRPCVVQLALRMPRFLPVLQDRDVIAEFEFTMQMQSFSSSDKTHHYLMIIEGAQYTVELECASRLDKSLVNGGFYYHPTQVTIHIETSALVYLMAAHNDWFKKYLQMLGVLPK